LLSVFVTFDEGTKAIKPSQSQVLLASAWSNPATKTTTHELDPSSSGIALPTTLFSSPQGSSLTYLAHLSQNHAVAPPPVQKK
jgi:hypothetical protein